MASYRSGNGILAMAKTLKAAHQQLMNELVQLYIAVRGNLTVTVLFNLIAALNSIQRSHSMLLRCLYDSKLDRGGLECPKRPGKMSKAAQEDVPSGLGKFKRGHKCDS